MGIAKSRLTASAMQAVVRANIREQRVLRGFLDSLGVPIDAHEHKLG